MSTHHRASPIPCKKQLTEVLNISKTKNSPWRLLLRTTNNYITTFCKTINKKTSIKESWQHLKTNSRYRYAFSDVDVMGHVSNTVYQNYFDAGKLNYFEEVLPEMDFVTIGIVGHQ
jgi:hypothetical protein